MDDFKQGCLLNYSLNNKRVGVQVLLRVDKFYFKSFKKKNQIHMYHITGNCAQLENIFVEFPL